MQLRSSGDRHQIGVWETHGFESCSRASEFYRASFLGLLQLQLTSKDLFSNSTLPVLNFTDTAFHGVLFSWFQPTRAAIMRKGIKSRADLSVLNFIFLILNCLYFWRLLEGCPRENGFWVFAALIFYFVASRHCIPSRFSLIYRTTSKNFVHPLNIFKINILLEKHWKQKNAFNDNKISRF